MSRGSRFRDRIVKLRDRVSSNETFGHHQRNHCPNPKETTARLSVESVMMIVVRLNEPLDVAGGQLCCDSWRDGQLRREYSVEGQPMIPAREPATDV